MHEASVAQSILNIASKKLASTAHTDTVTAIHVIIGQFRNVDIDSLKFAFDNIRSMYAGCSSCQLEAEVVTARATCRGCSRTYNPDMATSFRCPMCGNGVGQLISGEELDVIGITLR